MTDRHVRFKLAWQRYRVGEVIEPPGTLRQWLIARGYCEPVQPDKPALILQPPTAGPRRRSHA